ncbi:MAG: glycosyltransferase family 39 protein [Candidatus Acidiferrum sp.]
MGTVSPPNYSKPSEPAAKRLFLNVNKSAIFVFVAAMILLSWRLDWPKGQSPDEKLYLSGSRVLWHQTPYLFNGHPYANTEHPPLAKYLMGLGIKVLGDNPKGWRIASVVAGAVTITTVFVWISGITDAFTGWIAVVLVATNGFWFCMSRIAMLSIFELCFCVLGFYFLDKHKPVLSGVALGLAMACRWNAAFAIILLVLWCIKQHDTRAALKIIGSSFVAYVVAFLPAVNFSIVEFLKAQKYILEFHSHAIGNVSLAQSWYLWPFKTSPEYSMGFLLGNPVVIAVGFVAAVVLIARSEHKLLGWAPIVFWLQWPLIGRTMQFYYYFLDSMVFLSIAAAILLSKTRTRWIPIAAASASALWFLFHYAGFAYL